MRVVDVHNADAPRLAASRPAETVSSYPSGTVAHMAAELVDDPAAQDPVPSKMGRTVGRL
jgi:hypothetical protein